MPDIELRNKNSKIVGIDSNGNEVPVQLGDVDADALSSQRQSYVPDVVTNADSPFTTDGRSVYYLDSSGGPVTVELSTADAENGNVLELYDVGESAGTNAITVQTEGAESINPGGNSSIQITQSGAFVKFRNHLGNWFTDRRRQSESVTTGRIDIGDNNFVTTGDVLPVFWASETGTTSVSSTSFTAIPSTFDSMIQSWESIPGTPQVKLLMDAFVGLATGSHTIQIWNGKHGEEVISYTQTDDDSGFETEWQDYTPPDTSVRMRWYARGRKSASGDDDATYNRPVVLIGVKL